MSKRLQYAAKYQPTTGLGSKLNHGTSYGLVDAQEQFKALKRNIARMERQRAKARACGLQDRVLKLEAMIEDSKAKADMLVSKVVRYYHG